MNAKGTGPSIDRSWLRAGQGALLAWGAPLGWIALVFVASDQPMQILAEDVGVLSYMLVGTVLVFTSFGYYVGGLEQRALDDGLHDPLTGLPNRAFFDQRLRQLVSLARRQPQRPFALIVADLDRFKRINDQYGHAVGDDVLQAFADHLSAQLRKGETLCRVGGEEFALLAEEAELADAIALAERMRETAERVNHRVKDHASETVTASFGVAQYQLPLTAGQLFERADAALYRAKTEGRNRVCSAQ